MSAIDAAEPPPPLPLPLPVAAPLPRPAEPTLGETALGVGAVWLVDFSVLFAIGFVIGISARLHGRDPATAGAAMQQDPWAVGLSQTADYVLSLSVCWFLLCRRRGRGLIDGLRLRAPAWIIAGCGSLGVFMAFGATIVAAGGEHQSKMVQLTQGPAKGVILAFALLSPVVEEVYYRGLLLPVLTRKIGPWLAVPLIALWFGGLHAWQLWGDWSVLAWVTTMGLIWTLLRHRTGSLMPGISMHFCYNATAVMEGVLVHFLGKK